MYLCFHISIYVIYTYICFHVYIYHFQLTIFRNIYISWCSLEIALRRSVYIYIYIYTYTVFPMHIYWYHLYLFVWWFVTDQWPLLFSLYTYKWPDPHIDLRTAEPPHFVAPPSKHPAFLIAPFQPIPQPTPPTPQKNKKTKGRRQRRQPLNLSAVQTK